MARIIAQGHPAADHDLASDEPLLDRAVPWLGLGLVLLRLAIYVVSNPNRLNTYNHFVLQASAWLEDEAAIRYTQTII